MNPFEIANQFCNFCATLYNLQDHALSPSEEDIQHLLDEAHLPSLSPDQQAKLSAPFAESELKRVI